MPPQEWDEKGKLVNRTVSEWDEKGNPVQKVAATPDIKTGQGMEQYAQQQAHQTFTGTGDEGQYDERGRKVAGPRGKPLTLMEHAAQEQADRQTTLGARMNRAATSPTPMTSASMLYAPVPAAKSLIGAEVGGRAGGYVGKQISPKGEDYGKLVGGAVGAIGGPMVGNNLRARIARSLPRYPSGVPMRPSQAIEEKLFPDPYKPTATPAQRIPSGTNYGQYLERQRGIGVPGSAAQEAGYQPPVTKVPIRPEPPSPLTPEQVPGPDTAGKGNLLTPAARRGDPRAGQELMRRGRSVVYVPAEEYPGTRLEGTFSERVGRQSGLRGRPTPFTERRQPPSVNVGGVAGHPMNQLRVLSDKLSESGLTDFERRTLQSQWEDLTGRRWTPREKR